MEYHGQLSDDRGINIFTIKITDTQPFEDALQRGESQMITQDSQSLESVPQDSAIAFKLILTCVLVIASLFSNLVVFVIFSSRPVLLSVSNKLVLHLAVCNFSLTLVISPSIMNGVLWDHWQFGQVFCTVSSCVVTSLVCASSMTLLCISMDRYHAIARPLRYSRSLSSKSTRKCILTIWGFSLAFCLFSLALQIDYDHQLNICFVDLEHRGVASRIYVYLFTIIFFLLPLSFMLVVYLKIFDAAKRTTANARRNSLIPEQPKQLLVQQSPSREISFPNTYPTLVQKFYHKVKAVSRKKNPMLHKDDFKAAITGFLCVSTFTLSWIPFFFVLTIKVTSPELIQDWMGTSAILVVLTSCIFNPCLYVFRSQLVRREVDSYLRRRLSVDVTGVPFRRVNSTLQFPKVLRQQSEPCTHSSEYKENLELHSFITGRNFRSVSMTEET